MKKTREITTLALIAAIYAVLTIVLAPISYGNIQFRISEALCLLPIVYPKSKWGLFVGCIIANILNPTGANIFDIVFGSIATFIAADLISRIKIKYVAPIILAVVNGVIVGGVLAYTQTAASNFMYSFTLFGLQIAIAELLVGYIVGVPLISIIKKTQK